MEFTLFKRKGKNGASTYYVRFWDIETGELIKTLSTRKTSFKEATLWALEHIEGNGSNEDKNSPTFQDYTNSWFIWNKCPYIKKLLTKGKPFSRSHADGRRGILNNHLLPYFGELELKETKGSDIENFMENMGNKGFSSSTINSAFHTLSSILTEAYRQEIISTNPIDRIEPMEKQTQKSDLIPAEITDKLFSLDNIEEYWKGSLFHYLFNLLAFTTGLGQSEILALRKKNIDLNSSTISVTHTWDRKYGLKEAKREILRIVPIPLETQNLLEAYFAENGYLIENSLIFHGKSRERAIDHKAVNNYFKDAVMAAGADLTQTKITFQSWRHTYVANKCSSDNYEYNSKA